MSACTSGEIAAGANTRHLAKVRITTVTMGEPVNESLKLYGTLDGSQYHADAAAKSDNPSVLVFEGFPPGTAHLKITTPLEQ